jgi:hypothetical protein
VFTCTWQGKQHSHVVDKHDLHSGSYASDLCWISKRPAPFKSNWSFAASEKGRIKEDQSTLLNIGG